MVISTELMDGKLFGTNDNVSVAVFQCKPRMVIVEFGSIVLSSKVISFYSMINKLLAVTSYVLQCLEASTQNSWPIVSF